MYKCIIGTLNNLKEGQNQDLLSFLRNLLSLYLNSPRIKENLDTAFFNISSRLSMRIIYSNLYKNRGKQIPYGRFPMPQVGFISIFICFSNEIQEDWICCFIITNSS